MLNLIGSIVGMMAVMINMVAVGSVLPLRLSQRLWFAAGTGAYVGLASGLAAAGALAFSPEQKIPLIGVLCVTLLGGAATAWDVSPTFRDMLMAIPMSLLIR